MLEQLGTAWWTLPLVGLGAGLLSGGLGVGSGIVFVPVLATFFAVSQKSAQGTALAVMVPMALLGALRYWWNPKIEVDLLLVGALTCGALVGTLIGTELAGRLPAHWLRRAFAVLLVIAAIRMFLAPARRGGRTKPPTVSPPPNAMVQKGPAQ